MNRFVAVVSLVWPHIGSKIQFLRWIWKPIVFFRCSEMDRLNMRTRPSCYLKISIFAKPSNYYQLSTIVPAMKNGMSCISQEQSNNTKNTTYYDLLLCCLCVHLVVYMLLIFQSSVYRPLSLLWFVEKRCCTKQSGKKFQSDLRWSTISGNKPQSMTCN
jgi:hypothetical protein